MPFDPNLPQPGDDLDADVVRAQFHGLKDLIDAIPAGPEGPTGAPGEVTAQELSDAIQTTSANTNGVELLLLAVSDPPTQAEVQAVVDWGNALLLALRR